MPPPPQVGEQTRPLTMVSIEEFLRDFGLEPEFATHSNIRGLSGGQKVKLVLAAAMWSNPHMLIMDEPTNYLDRESLGALALAIKEWNGEAKGGGDCERGGRAGVQWADGMGGDGRGGEGRGGRAFVLMVLDGGEGRQPWTTTASHSRPISPHSSCPTGGVVVISHHSEFTGALCNETWLVADGRLTITKTGPKVAGEDEADE